MTDVDSLERTINTFNFSAIVAAPWGRLSSIQNRTLAMEKKSQDIKKGEKEARDMLDGLGTAKAPLKNAQKVREGAGFIKERVEKLQEKMDAFPNEGQQLLADIQKSASKARELVHLLIRYYSSGGVSRPVASGDVTRWIDEATFHSEQMQNRTEFLEKRLSRAEVELKYEHSILYTDRVYHLSLYAASRFAFIRFAFSVARRSS